MSRLPVLFIGHGSPMNALAGNAYTRALRRLGETLPRPRAVLCVSAHWMTEGTWMTHQERPRTIHDFYGFPQPLLEVRYPAPGAPALAEEIAAKVGKVSLDDELWGYDHGNWSVLRHLYPDADVPVLQLSLDMPKPAAHHFALGQKLAALRDAGVLIVGSGNLVHNLRTIRWEPDAEPYDWAAAFDAWLKEKITAGDTRALVEDAHATEAGRQSIPTWDHWYPFLYALGAANGDAPGFVHEGLENGSISMRSVRWG